MCDVDLYGVFNHINIYNIELTYNIDHREKNYTFVEKKRYAMNIIVLNYDIRKFLFL